MVLPQGARRGSAGTDWNGQYGYQSYDWRPRHGDSYIRRQVSPRTSGAAGFGKNTEEGNKKKGSEGGREGADEVMKEAGEEEGGAEQVGGTSVPDAQSVVMWRQMRLLPVCHYKLLK